MIGRHAADQCAVAVGIENAHNHVHARAVWRAGRNQGLAGQHIIEVARDGRGFKNTHAVVVKHRHLAERMPRQVLGLPRFARQHVDLNLLKVGRSFFSQQHLDGADIGGAVETPKSHFGHDAIL